MLRSWAIGVIIGLLFASMGLAQEATPTDDIVIKAADAQMFQVTANIKLTPDQITQVRSILTDYIVKVRNLQQDLEDGNIDGKTMYSKRSVLTADENRQLSEIFTPTQMKVWLDIQKRD